MMPRPKIVAWSELGLPLNTETFARNFVRIAAHILGEFRYGDLLLIDHRQAGSAIRFDKPPAEAKRQTGPCSGVIPES